MRECATVCPSWGWAGILELVPPPHTCMARRMSPSLDKMSCDSVGPSQVTLSASAMKRSRPTIDSWGSGLNRNLAHRDAMGGISREM
jgi:hypothetical protein